MSLHWRTLGSVDTPAVLFLHGFLGRGADWLPEVESFSPSCFCILVDLPGHGESVGLDVPTAYTMSGAAELVLEVLDRLQVKEAGVVGYSMGGRLALYLVLKYPEVFSRALLESASPGLADEGERTERAQRDATLAERIKENGLGPFLASWYAQPLFKSLAENPARLAERIRDRQRNDPAELALSLQYMGSGVQPSLWADLESCRQPVMAVAGGRDPKFRDLALKMAGLSNCIQPAIVPDAGHAIHLEQRERFVELLGGFFGLQT